MQVSPRPYQSAAVSAILGEFDRGIQTTLLILPTGTGKTVVFGFVGDARPWGRVLVLAPRQELIYQAQERIEAITGDRGDIEMGKEYAPTMAMDLFSASKYVIGSVQTVSKDRRLHRFDWKDFGLVVLDEGHHAPARTWRKIIDYIKKQNPNIKILLVTATADRSDGKKLDMVETIAYRYEIDQAIGDGWLVPIRQSFASIEGLDISRVHTRGGDLDEGELSAILRDDGGEMPHKVASAMVKASGQEKALIFTVDVAHAKSVADIINRMPGKKAVAVDGTWERDKRRAVLESYRRGEFQFLVNCQLFLEGWDEPTVSVIGMARPTKSRALYAQAIGRGLRPLPGLVDGLAQDSERRESIAASDKPRALIVDLVGNSGRHKLVCTAEILGRNYTPGVIEAAHKRAAKRKTPVDMAALLEEEKLRLDAKREDSERRRGMRKSKVYGDVQMTLVDVDPFGRDAGPASRDDEFKSQPRTASGRQIDYIERAAGIDAMGWSHDEAQKLIREIKAREGLGLCSIRQRSLLERCGYQSATHMSRAKADAAIGMLKANYWKKPAAIGRSDLTIGVKDGEFRIRWKRPDGTKVSVGKVFKTEGEARALGEQILDLEG